MKHQIILTSILFTALISSAVTVSFAGEGTTLEITSSAFQNGGRIPVKFSCSGENISPALRWTSMPPATKSVALVVDDPDAPIGTFVHWVFFNLPPTIGGLPENVPASDSAYGGIQGLNGRGKTGYTGPCPPPGAPHHYHFRLYALDETLSLKNDADAENVKAAANGHVLASTDLVGVFQR